MLSDENEVNLLKRLKMQNVELKAELKQSQNHVEYVEQSKIRTVRAMASEIQRLRQQIANISKSNNH